MRQLLSLCFLAFVTFSIQAQDNFKWGQVSPTDLKMTSYEKDPEAEAVVLDEEGEITFDLSKEKDITCVFTRHVRIKILSEKGINHANISLPFYHHDGYEKINAIKGFTYAPNGEKTKLSQKEVHTTKQNQYWSEVKFAMPNVKVGSVIEYKYIMKVSGVFQPPVWIFQGNIPRRRSKVTFSTPRVLHYIVLKESFHPLESNSETNMQTISIPKYVTVKMGTANPKGEARGYTKTEMNVTTTVLIARDAPAFRNVSFIPNKKDYLSKVRFQLKATEYSKGLINPIENSWTAYAKEKWEHPSFGKQITSKRNFKKLLQEIQPLIPQDANTLAKIDIISKFIFNNVTWNKKYSIYSEKSLDNAFQSKSANNAEMNLMLTALLNHFGIKAEPLLVSTRANGKVIKAYPIASQFNHVLAYIADETDPLFLDLTVPGLKPGLVRSSAINGEGLLIQADGFDWINVATNITSKTTMATIAVMPEGDANASLKIIADNYEAYDHRYWYKKKENDNDYLSNFIQDEINIGDDINLSVKNEKDESKRMFSEAEFSINQYANASGDLIYLPLMFTENWGWLEKAFQEETRDYPLMLPYPFKDKFVINVEIPEGYVVEELPVNAKISTSDDKASFAFLCSEKGGKIQVVTNLKINDYLFTNLQYPELKQFFDLVFEKMGEMIVLKKQG